VAGNPVVAQAIICAKCGSKLRPGREKCPRCRAVVTVPDPAAAVAASKRLATVAAVLSGAFVLLLIGLWVVRGTTTPSPQTRAAAKPAPVAAAPANAPSSAPAALPPIGRDRPFLDAAGAGTLAYGAGDYATALAKFQAAIEKNPQDADSLSNLGQVLVRMNRPADAIPYLQRAVSLAPQQWAYQFNLARALGLVGRMAESIDGYRRAQELFPDDYVTAFNLALALHKSGDEAGAVEQYQKAINLQPDDASFRKALGVSYERLQKRTEAAAAYQEYLRLSPAAPDADTVRARIAELTGASAPSAVPAAAERQ
jgi:tetratricopeptide (TPR) repeat protein